MRKLRHLLIIIMPLIIFLTATPKSEIDLIKSNATPVKSNFISIQDGLFLNPLGTLSAINVFNRYAALGGLIKISSELLTNVERELLYNKKLYSNMSKVKKNEVELLENRFKKTQNNNIIVSGISLGGGILGGALMSNDNNALQYIGLGLTLSAVLTITINYLIVRFKKLRRLIQ